MSKALIRAYYAAFNAQDMERFFALLTDDVRHAISQGGEETGKPAFARFMAHMNQCYRERITDLVVMTDTTGTQAAAEFTVHGTYISTDPGVPAGTPAAAGQTYTLPAGAFFSLAGGRIARISNHYNLGDWVRRFLQQAPADRGVLPPLAGSLRRHRHGRTRGRPPGDESSGVALQ